MVSAMFEFGAAYDIMLMVSSLGVAALTIGQYPQARGKHVFVVYRFSIECIYC